MILKAIEKITKADIDAHITEKRAEIKTLEYKMKLPDPTDDAKKEFLADISSFANASGGDIIYGIEPDKDANGKTNGEPKVVAPITGANADETKLWLENSIRDGIAPRLPVQIVVIKGWNTDGNGFIILIRIPKSFASPHMVTLKNTSRFYARNSSGKYQLDVGEIRNAFLATDSQAERIKHFREDRLAKILADETPVKLSSPYRTVLHLIPLGNFLNKSQIDLKKAFELRANLPPFHSSGNTCRFNLDGFLNFGVSNEQTGVCRSYCQVFRDGSIESVSASLLAPLDGQRSQRLPAPVFLSSLLEWMNRCLATYQSLSIAGPAVLMASLMGVKGMRILLHPEDLFSGVAADRDHLFIPEILVENCQTQPASTLRPIMDTLFNAFGYRECPDYSEDGRFA